MGALSDWVRQVVMVLVLTGVVELALPTGALRRYVQVVLGLLVLLAIVRPVLAWLGSEPATLVPAWQQVLEGMSAGPGRQAARRGPWVPKTSRRPGTGPAAWPWPAPAAAGGADPG